MKLPSPTSALDASASNGWQGPGKTVLCLCYGLQGEPIGKEGGYLFKDGDIVDTMVYESSITSTTVGGEGTPAGSTELDKAAGRNCKLTDEQHICAGFYLERIAPEGYAWKQSTPCFWNRVADDLHTIINFAPCLHAFLPGDHVLCGIALACVTRKICGPEATTFGIMKKGYFDHAEPEVLQTLGRGEGHYELVLRHLTRKSIVARNMINKWVQEDVLLSETSFDGMGEKGKKNLNATFDVLREDETITFVRKKASSGRRIVKILLDKLHTNPGCMIASILSLHHCDCNGGHIVSIVRSREI